MKKTLISLLWLVLGLALLCALLVAIAYAIYQFQTAFEEAAYAPLMQIATIVGLDTATRPIYV